MTQSPGHKKWPEHKVREKPLEQRLQVKVQGQVVADTTEAIELDEDDYRARYYVPRSDIDMSKLSPSSKTSHCPFKGEAHYYNINVGTEPLQDSAWTYEEPYDEHRTLADHLAFYEEMPGIEINRLPS